MEDRIGRAEFVLSFAERFGLENAFVRPIDIAQGHPRLTLALAAALFNCHIGISLPSEDDITTLRQERDELLSQAVDIKGLKVLAVMLPDADASTLRVVMDKMKDQLKSAAIVLAAVNEGKVSLIAGVTADATNKVKAGELVNFVAQQVGGKGGGRADMAQAGGTDPKGLPAALAGVQAWVGERL